jgi:hypothetical protein
MYNSASLSLANSSLKTPAIVKLAKELLASSPFDMRPSDKDGCCVFIHRDNLECGILQQVINSKSYTSHILHDDWVTQMSAAYSSCVADLLLRESDILNEAQLLSLKNSLLKVWRSKGSSGLVARIDCTFKTHKPQGEVEVRLLHSSKFHPFKPLLKFYSEQLQASLATFDHVLRDTPDFLNKLPSSCYWSPNARFLQIDIKD